SRRGAAEGDLRNVRQRGFHPLDTESDLPRVAAELLAKGDGRGIHEVRATRLDRGLPQLSLDLEGGGQMVEGGDEVMQQGARGGQVNGGGEHVVRGLRGV